MNEKEYLEWFDSKDLGFEMFTKAGNRKCKSITRSVIKKIFGKKRISQEEVIELAASKIRKVMDKDGYREILDSEPPYHIKHYIMRACKIAGYDHDFDRFDLSSACYR